MVAVAVAVAYHCIHHQLGRISIITITIIITKMSK